jgi:hypothetical protein
MLLAAAAVVAAAPAGAADTVADKVFAADLLAKVTSPAVLRYRYEMSGATIDRPFDSVVRMDVREIGPDGAKKVWFEMFEGPNRRQFGPTAAREQNPLVIVFLQRDVTAMGNMTGGASGYFQQQIRRAFTKPAEVSAVEVELDGRKVQATRVVLRPFRDDPSIARFPQFKDKAYEFVVAPEVPGGVYRLGTSVPDPTGKVVLAESVTFAGIDPAATPAAAAPAAAPAAGGERQP